MHRIDTPGATPQGTFTDGNPAGGIPATELDAAWFNGTQEELAGFVESRGLTLDKERQDQLAEALDHLVYGRGFRPNELLNGEFRTWQRGASLALGTAELYTADRWFARADGSAGSGAATVSRTEFAFGQTDVPGQPRSHLRLLQTVGSTITSPRVGQRIEDIRRFLGTTITVAFWCRSDVTLQGTLQVDRYFGTGGSAADNVHAQTFTCTSTWSRVVATVEVAGYAGQTLGTDSFLEVRIDLPGGATFQFDLADVLVKFGDYAAPFPRVSELDEEFLLARYFEKSYGITIAPGTPGLANVSVYEGDADPHCYGLVTRYRNRKSGTRVLTWYSPSAGTAARVDVNGTPQTVTGTSNDGPNTTGYPTISTGTGTGVVVRAHWTCDSELYRL